MAGIHLGIASLTGRDHWTLGDGEAANMAKAIENVARHYPKLAGHEKLIDWVMLVQTIGVVYGTRIYLSIPDKPTPRKMVEQPPGNVTQFGVIN